MGPTDRITKKKAPTDKEKWLALRSKSIGGSEAGAIMGFSPWQSAYALWCERTGRTPAFAGNLATEVGTTLEPFIAAKFAEISGFGRRVMRSSYIWYNEACPHMHASPDRLIYATASTNATIVAGLECKSTSELNARRIKDSDFPAIYYAQCVHYMAVLNVPLWYLAVLIGNRDFRIYQLRRSEDIPVPEWCCGSILVDDEDIETLVDSCGYFWGHLEANTPPAIDGSDSSTEALTTVFKDQTDGKEVHLPLLELECRQLLELKEQKTGIESQIARVENVIKAQMEDAERAIVPGYKVTWKSVTSNRIDSAALKKACPDIYQQYTKPSVSRRFEVKEDR